MIRKAVKRIPQSLSIFVAIGTICFLIDYSTYLALLSAGAPLSAAKAMSSAGAIILNYLLNSRFNFGGKHEVRATRGLAYVALYGFTTALQVAINSLLFALTAHVHISALTAIGIGAAVNYLCIRRLFKHWKKEEAPKNYTPLSLTIFSIPKGFTEPHTRIIQRNAIRSWKALPGCEVFLVGNDPGVAEVAQEFGVGHIPEVAVNEFGTPMLDSAFALVRARAKNKILVYANADIIFTRSMLDAAWRVSGLTRDFLLVGRRTDIDITEEINISNKDWETAFLRELASQGKLHSAAGIDYFMFRKHLFADLPPFAVGRVGWDNWTLNHAKTTGLMLIDATPVVTVGHQNHEYPSLNKGVARKTNPEALRNISYIKNKANACTIEDATWILSSSGIKRNYLSWLPFVKRNLRSLFA